MPLTSCCRLVRFAGPRDSPRKMSLRPAWDCDTLESMSDATRLLRAIEAGDPLAAADLLPLVYDELRRLAAQRLASEKPGQTLTATALVHEAYLRLVGKGDAGWDGRGHFFAAAAEAMRRILVEAARRKQRLKRGGDRTLVVLDLDRIPDEPAPDDDLLALDEALNNLATINSQAARLVELRYFAGLTNAEAATLLGISPRKADQVWAYARTWLFNRLRGDAD
jgi:RNA polymerase sigma factor (TIGR02999 family)